jgi:hypothetical protein
MQQNLRHNQTNLCTQLHYTHCRPPACSNASRRPPTRVTCICGMVGAMSQRFKAGCYPQNPASTPPQNTSPRTPEPALNTLKNLDSQAPAALNMPGRTSRSTSPSRPFYGAQGTGRASSSSTPDVPGCCSSAAYSSCPALGASPRPAHRLKTVDRSVHSQLGHPRCVSYTRGRHSSCAAPDAHAARHKAASAQ